MNRSASFCWSNAVSAASVVPPLANVDLSPLLLIILLQVLLIPLAYLRALVAGAF